MARRSGLRRLLPLTLAALIGAAVTAPATWYLARLDSPEPPPSVDLEAMLSRPQTREGLRAELVAQLPRLAGRDAVRLELAGDQPAATALPPGRYRVHLICGLMSRQGSRAPVAEVELKTPDRVWQVELPCPSTAQIADQQLTITDPVAGAVIARSSNPETGRLPPGSLLIIQLVPLPDLPR